jgi:hypothetical protein
MCDDLAMLKENKLFQMLDHFDMTFNVVDNDVANKLIHDGLSCTRFEHIVNSHGKTMNFFSPMLGWFNDKHCEINYINDCFTYICKLSCDISYWNLCNTLLIHYKQYLCKSINVKNVKGVKMDDIYIYHVHTLSLVLACLQNKHRRGWLSFKEREDDEDMPTSDTPILVTRRLIFQVNSISNYIIYYFHSESKITTFMFLIRRIRRDLYKPRVKMRDRFGEEFMGLHQLKVKEA